MADRHVIYRGVSMIAGWPERIREAQKLTSCRRNGEDLLRIRFGRESGRTREIEGPCHDCGVLAGELHVPGCDAETCPGCEEQMIQCSCDIERVEEATVPAEDAEPTSTDVGAYPEFNVSPARYPRVVWTGAARERLLPHRGFDGNPPPRRLPRSGVTDRWAQTWSQHEHAWREGLREPAPAGCRHIDEVGSALTRRHEVLVEPHDTELEATALAMFLPYRSLSRYYAEFDTGSVGADDWVDSTVPLAGIEFTMDVLSRAQGLIRAGVGDQEAARNNEMGRLWLKNAGSNGNPVASEDPFAGWRALRYHLGAAEEHAYEQARRRAEQLRSTAPLPVRCGLSFAFPEQSDWVAQDAREGLRSDNFVYYGAIVLAGLRDPGLALEVVRDLKGRSKVVEPLTFSFELVRHLEEHAASVLMEMVEGGHFGRKAVPPPLPPPMRPPDPPSPRVFESEFGPLAALRLIRSAEAADFLSRKLQYDLAVPSVMEAYFTSEPLLAIPALTRRIVEYSKALQAESTLKKVLQKLPPDHDPGTVPLDEACRAILSRLRRS